VPWDNLIFSLTLEIQTIPGAINECFVMISFITDRHQMTSHTRRNAKVNERLQMHTQSEAGLMRVEFHSPPYVEGYYPTHSAQLSRSHIPDPCPIPIPIPIPFVCVQIIIPAAYSHIDTHI